MNKIKHEPERTCMGCGTKKNKENLLRIVKNGKNEINIDKIGNMEGRGAYICYSGTCLEKLLKNRRLERSLQTKMTDEIYENLRGVIIGK